MSESKKQSDTGINSATDLNSARVDELERTVRLLSESLEDAAEQTKTTNAGNEYLRSGIRKAVERLGTIAEGLGAIERALPAVEIVATASVPRRARPSSKTCQAPAGSPVYVAPNGNAHRSHIAAPTSEVMLRSDVRSDVTSPANGEMQLGKAHRAILASLAQYPISLTREQLAFLAGYHPRTPGFANALGALRSAGLVSPAFPAELTDAGRAAAADVRPVDNTLELWLGRFGKAERAILQILLREWPNQVERQALADEAGYHPRTPGFANALGRLRGLGLVDGLALHADFAQLVGR